MNSYIQEQEAEFERIEEGVVVIRIRGTEKRLIADEIRIAAVKSLDLVMGQDIRLQYTDKINWEIKKKDFTSKVEKYFRRD